MTAILCRLVAAAMLALGLALGGAAQSQSADTSARTSYAHCPTGILIPGTDYERYDWVLAVPKPQSPNGCVRTIRYRAPSVWGELFISIQPAGDAPCAEQFARENLDVQSRWRRLTLRPAQKPLRLSGPFAEQHSVRYTNPAIRTREGKPETVLTLWVGCIGPGEGEKGSWLVRYESDFAAAGEAKVADLPEKIFVAVDWSTLQGN